MSPLPVLSNQWGVYKDDERFAVHVAPINDVRKHKLNGVECWCGLRCMLPCPYCEDGDCGCCDHAFVPCTPAEAALFIHRAADGRK